ncbi:hypothetical protein T4B_4813 [Trichinella pseudospiralis]|uniref:Uncharacterized protein n=1 Tax=Trichinella pseudospiralis TaxID=6337 RepID=A0A0V1EDY5_TRIPS|nr:hypothetical protein T4A_5188 [Trichinella pseudospiralis]KRZ00382.1 hypothetical protein T4B_4813 [Trichinella pseudospiralis]
MQIFICPRGTPEAMPRAFFRKFRIFQKFSPRRRLRLRLRANKNLHIPSGYALGILLHNICPQAMQKFAYANFLCPKAMPGALPEAIFQKFLKFSIF